MQLFELKYWLVQMRERMRIAGASEGANVK